MEDGVTGAGGASLTSLKSMVEEALSLTGTARLEAAKDRDYYDGPGQWTDAERAALRKRKQPDNYFNRIRPGIDGILGVLEQGQTDPKAFPRNPDDEDAAEVATKSLRYIEDRARFDRTKLDCAETFFIEGICALINEVDDDQEIAPTLIAYSEFIYDPRSRRRDFRDARYLGVAKWQWADDVAARYPDAKVDVEAAVNTGSMVDQINEDKPTGGVSGAVAWADRRKRRLLVAEVYYREGPQWMRCVFHAGGILEEGPSPYLDQKRRPKCPIEAASCYVDRENNRYGKVRDMRGPQDEINKRRSKLLHELSVAQIQAVDPAAVEVDADQARAEAAKPDGVIPFGWQRVNRSDIAAGQAQLLTEAKAEIERMGPNPAILGRQGENSSGRANLVRQQAGLTELATVLGVFDDFLLRCYRGMWDLAKQTWQGPKWIRVTDEEGSLEWIGLNKPTGMMGHNGGPELENPVAEMDVDIIIETTPDTANVAQEQFQMLTDLAKAGFPIPPLAIIKASSLPNKRDILNEMKAAAEQPDPAKELENEGKLAEVNKTKSETALNIAKARKEYHAPLLDAAQTAASIHQGHQTAAGGPAEMQDAGATESYPPQGEAGPPLIGR